MTKVNKQKTVLFGAFILLVLFISGFVYVAASMVSVPDEPPVGELTPINSGSTSQPGVSSSGVVWQSLFVTNNDGSSYWANAPKQFDFMSVFGSQTGQGDDFKQIKSLQNNIYVNLNVQSVSTWSFSCQETITVTDKQGYEVKRIVDSQTVNANGQSIAANQNVWVTGATVTEQQLQSLLSLPEGEYYFTVSLSNINLSINVNGQQQNLVASAGDSENVLTWLIKVDDW